MGSLGIHEAAPGSGNVVPGHAFPLIRYFSGHTVRFFIIGIHFVETFIYLYIRRRLPYCVLAQKQCITSDDTSVLIWNIGTGVWQLVVH